ncbi:UNVERIFIED_ORG: hypothetical protein ABIB52_002514 [Arthrobacter sp. UYCu721]
MTEDLKDRPAVLRRTPRPAPDEKVDPVDYSPAAVAPAIAKAEETTPTGGGMDVGAPTEEPAPRRLQDSVTEAFIPIATTAVPTTTPTRQSSEPARASKTAANRKTTRREVTFPLSTRLSQEVLDVLYAAAEDEGISVRETIEQAIKSRWG